jgi:hypothetical protein
LAPPLSLFIYLYAPFFFLFREIECKINNNKVAAETDNAKDNVKKRFLYIISNWTNDEHQFYGLIIKIFLKLDYKQLNWFIFI